MTNFVLAGGCFWCLDSVFRDLKGVDKVISGYSGGQIDNPDYESVCKGRTGHAEAISIDFDEKIIPESTILDIFFLIHNPTTLNRQGNDVGTQYRSVMFWQNEQQNNDFQNAINRAQEHWDDPIVTGLVKLEKFWPAEDYHQDYFNKNPGNGYCQIVISPKIIMARQEFKKWFD